MEVNHFFFYDPLMSGFPSHEKFLKPHTLSVEKAITNGSLYHLPNGYPAMTFGHGVVKGEVMLFEKPSAMVWYLDSLKGYYGVDKSNLSERIIQLVKKEDTGEQVLAYIYVYPGYRLMELQHWGVNIPQGDWLEFMGDFRQIRELEYWQNSVSLDA